MSISRRELAALGLAIPALVPLHAGEPKTATPKEVLGPFFRKGAPNTAKLRAAGAAGTPLHVRGVVYNTKGDIVPEARVELWHADDHGDYDTQGFSYRARLTPNDKGLYEVETILPGHYQDRPAQHIHYMISAPGHRTLVTQAYFQDDPFFEGDYKKNYRKRNIVSNLELVKPVKNGTLEFDIVLERL
jgi:protocatechuate 3,4-dioxygenase beta subunit